MPLSLTVTHTPLRIGVTHGHLSVPVGEHDALSAIARQMDVDVLVSGHTHKSVILVFSITAKPELLIRLLLIKI